MKFFNGLSWIFWNFLHENSLIRFFFQKIDSKLSTTDIMQYYYSFRCMNIKCHGRLVNTKNVKMMLVTGQTFRITLLSSVQFFEIIYGFQNCIFLILIWILSEKTLKLTIFGSFLWSEPHSIVIIAINKVIYMRQIDTNHRKRPFLVSKLTTVNWKT